ncbi:23S rRNA (adenine(2503)-C(2))-methyltransferase RlmN, partial [Bacteroidota bacterium]
WIHNHLVSDFNFMLNLPKDLRKTLMEDCSLQTLNSIDSINSVTNTKKYLFETWDGNKIESVFIPDKKRNTLCLSTQVGCPLDCKFCATGLMNFKRNLTTAEIIDQYLLIAKEQGKEEITNIVYMGMGEPLLNFKNTIESLKIFIEESISRNRITVSTSGIPPKIKELADSNLKVKIALSLHSCDDTVRSKLMPINNKYNIQENLEALRYYSRKTRTRITFEYTMIKDINDSHDDIKNLVKISNQLPSKINIIPFNSIKHMNPGGISNRFESTPHDKILEFVQKLRENNLTVMIRETQGDDIAAACGQLAIKHS